MTNVLKINDAINEGLRSYFRENGFFMVDPPILITASVEGGSTLFSFNYFGKKAYLTQSSQLYLETFMASLEKVYCSAPSFRAEKSRTRRHLTEFMHLEAEEAFCDLWGTMRTQEDMITHVAQKLARENGRELRELGRDPIDLDSIESPFEKIDYGEAVSMVQAKGVEMEYGDDFGVEQERSLVEEFEKPFFIHSFASEAKAFYHRPDPKNPGVVLCADMLAPEGNGEVIGGGERIFEIDVLLARIEEADLDPINYEWYIDLRRYGTCPHAGFGLGIARLVKWFCKLDHIRQSVPFPRTINRIYP
jgi:asparaginyl-tRNA synthetase